MRTVETRGDMIYEADYAVKMNVEGRDFAFKDKIWKGQAMYTHTIDRKSAVFHGTTTIYSDENDRPYILLPVIPRS